jgi:guanylate kinase
MILGAIIESRGSKDLAIQILKNFLKDEESYNNEMNKIKSSFSKINEFDENSFNKDFDHILIELKNDFPDNSEKDLKFRLHSNDYDKSKVIKTILN